MKLKQTLWWLLGLLIACQANHTNESDQNPRKLPLFPLSADKEAFLSELDILRYAGDLKWAFDTAEVMPTDVLAYCQRHDDRKRKAALIGAVSYGHDNDLREQNPDYWAGILYDLEKFVTSVSVLKTDEHRTFMDVGSGNGEKLYAALCLGFDKSYGLEYAKPLVTLSKQLLAPFGDATEVMHGDALEVEGSYYQKADFIYMYSPIKSNTVMANLFWRIVQNMREGAILLEVRMVYQEELRKVSGLEIPHRSELVVRKEGDQLLYADYDAQGNITWTTIPILPSQP
jgi:hypothetical protein